MTVSVGDLLSESSIFEGERSLLDQVIDLDEDKISGWVCKKQQESFHLDWMFFISSLLADEKGKTKAVAVVSSFLRDIQIDAFFRACELGYSEVVILMMPILELFHDLGFEAACNNNRFDVARALIDSVSPGEIEDNFLDMCIEGRLELVLLMLAYVKQDIIESGFGKACECGRTAVVRGLIECDIPQGLLKKCFKMVVIYSESVYSYGDVSQVRNYMAVAGTIKKHLNHDTDDFEYYDSLLNRATINVFGSTPSWC